MMVGVGLEPELVPEVPSMSAVYSERINKYIQSVLTTLNITPSQNHSILDDMVISFVDYFHHSHLSGLQNIRYLIKLYNQMRLILGILFLLITAAQAGSITYSLSNFNTLAPSVTYQLNFTFTTTSIPASSTPVVTLSNHYLLGTLTNCQYATSSADPYSTTTCSTSSNSSGAYITPQYVYPATANSQSFLALQLTLENPWAAVNQSVVIGIYNGATTIDSTSQTIPYVASALTNCTYLSSSAVNGATSTRTVSFIPSVKLISGSQLQVTSPLWFNSGTNLVTSPVACSAISQVSSSITCTSLIVSDTQVFTFNSLFLSNKTVTSPVSLSFSSLYNPWSLAPSSPIKYQLLREQGGVPILSQQCQGLSLTNTELNSLRFVVFAFTNTIATTSSAFMLFQNFNPLTQSGAILKLSWSSGPSIDYTGSQGTVISSNSSSLIIGSYLTSTYTANNSVPLGSVFTITTPPSSRPYTITYTTMQDVGGVYYGIDTSTSTYQCPTGTLTSASLTSTDNSINSVTTYTLTFTLANALTSGSSIAISMPSQLTLGSTCSTSNGLLACSIDNTTSATVAVSGSVSSATTVTITFPSVTNPTQGLTTDSASIITYWDSGNDSVVDTLSSGLTVAIQSKQIPLGNVFVTPASLTTYATTTYTFSVLLLDPVPTGGTLAIIFPADIAHSGASLVAGTTTFNTSSCSLSITSDTVQLTGCFPSGYSTLGISIDLAGIVNPSSLKTTTSFAFESRGSIGSVNSISSGLNITMTTAATSANFSTNPLSTTVHDSTSYTLSIQFTVPHSIGDYLEIEVGSGIQITNSVICTAVSGIASVSCSQLNTTSLNLTLVAVPTSSIAFSVSPIVNYDVSDTNISIGGVVYSAQGYAMETLPVYQVSFTPTTLALASITTSNETILGAASNIELNVAGPFTLSSTLDPTLTTLTITLPTEITSLANTSCSASAGTSCTLTNSTTLTLSQPGLTLNTTITINNLLFPYPYTPSSFTLDYRYDDKKVALTDSGVEASAYCTSPCQQCIQGDATSCLSCLPSPNLLTLFLSINNTCVSSCPSSFYSDTTNCIECTTGCGQCSSASNCSSCTTNYLYYQWACYSSCPNSTYSASNNTICAACNSTCLTCDVSVDNCTSCSSSLLLYANTCVSGCPDSFYNDSVSCLACSSICLTCSAQTVCTDCNSSLFFYDSSCHSTCPNSTYQVGTSCSNCSDTCLTCFNTSTTCTSCTLPLILHQNGCLSSCPSNYFNVSGSCQTCGNCTTCLSSTTCNSCLSSFYLYQGTCYSTCPDQAPVPETSTQTCAKCQSTCLSCNSAGDECYSCRDGYLILSGNCYTDCPSGYKADHSSGQCKEQIKLTKIYTPTTICFAIFLPIILYAKWVHPATQMAGTLAALGSPLFLAATIILMATADQPTTTTKRLLADNLSSQAKVVVIGVEVAAIAFCVIIGVIQFILLQCRFRKDKGLRVWMRSSPFNKCYYYFLSIFSMLHCGIFRLAYSRLFQRECLSCYWKEHKSVVTLTNWTRASTLLTANLPTIALGVYLIRQSEGNSQTQIYAVDLIIISSLLAVLTIVDIATLTPEDFEDIRKQFPYLWKLKKPLSSDFNSSHGSLNSVFGSYPVEDVHCKTEADAKQKTGLDHMIGNFGAIQQIEEHQIAPQELQSAAVMTVPQYNAQTAQISFNPYQLKQQQDNLFFREQQYTKKFKQLKEHYGLQDQVELSQEEQNSDSKEADEGTEVDPYSTKKVEQIINERKRSADPMEYLKDMGVDDPIPEEQLNTVRELAEAVGVDPDFIAQTFGTERHYNPQMLNELLDPKEGQAGNVRALFNSQNSQQRLRDVFGPQSTVDTNKVKEILSDPDCKTILEPMFSKDKAFLPTQAVKELLAKGKYSAAFVVRLLNDNLVDKQKLKELIEDNPGGSLETLSQIAHLGGDDLEKHQRMSNILGKQAEVDPKALPRVAEQLSSLSTSNLFDQKNKAGSTVIRGVVNNKKINLRGINPISQAPQIIEQFAELVDCGNEEVKEGIISVLQKGEYDPEQFKQLVQSAGNSQQQMAVLLNYLQKNQQPESPIDNWPETAEEQAMAVLPPLDIQPVSPSTQDPIRESHHYEEQEDKDLPAPSFLKKKNTRVRIKRQLAPVHLPSQPIYLQRIQGAHEASRQRQFRKKKKTEKKADKYMDEDNEVYDLDF